MPFILRCFLSRTSAVGWNVESTFERDRLCAWPASEKGNDPPNPRRAQPSAQHPLSAARPPVLLQLKPTRLGRRACVTANTLRSTPDCFMRSAMAPLRDFDLDDASRVQSPRPETPEPDSRQGRRNTEKGVQLLDIEGRLSDKVHRRFCGICFNSSDEWMDQFERCLAHIFAKYCTPRPATSHPSGPRHQIQPETTLLEPPPDACLSQVGLDRWAKDTNGTAFSEETKDEMKGFLDVTEAGNLTYVYLYLRSTK